MHNAAFAAAGIDARYELAELDADDVPRFVDQAREPDFLGLGVTAPYKQVVASLVDEVEPDAREIGAVNNVVRTDAGRLIGFNSDAPGFLAAAETTMGRLLTGANVAVAGGGGVAHAIVHACRKRGIAHLTVGTRTVPARVGTVDAVDLDGPDFRRALENADLVVNATSVGMIDPGATIDVTRLRSDATVFDVVYVPAETPLLAAARARGFNAANGSEMLICQAAIAFERWTGVGGMEDVMRQALAPLLADPSATA